MPHYEKLEEYGYTFVEVLREGSSYGFPGEYLLKDEYSGRLEVWFHNQNHASFGLDYNGKHLEFARSIPIDR